MLLPITPEPFSAPADREMLPSERRLFVRTHRTCVLGYQRLHDGPAMSVVYYVPTEEDELLVSTTAGRAKARAVARNPKISLCVLDERWPFVYLQVYADAVIDGDRELAVDVLMAVAGRMSGEPVERRHTIVLRVDGRRGATRCDALPSLRDVRPVRDPPKPGTSLWQGVSGAVPWESPDPS